MTIDALARPCVREATPYLPGKPIAEVQRELGIRRVIKLASNENPLGPSPRAARAALRAVKECHLYPEGSSPLLRQALARSLGVSAAQVAVGSGSDEILRTLCEAFLTPEDEVVVSSYGFIRFKQHAALMGARVVEAPMRDWKHDLEAMARSAGARTKIVFVASPNNPTGTYNTRAELSALLARLPQTALVVLDEAYCHYAAARKDYPDGVRELLPRRPNLVVLRTFSKAYGLAGLRIGYAVGAPGLIGWLDRVRLPFNVSLPAQRAGTEALKDSAHVRRSVRLVAKNREALARELKRLGMEAADSAANFLFVRSPLPGQEVFRRLLAAGVIVRPLDEYGLPHHLRISVGTEAANRALVKALRRALPGGPR